MADVVALRRRRLAAQARAAVAGGGPVVREMRWRRVREPDTGRRLTIVQLRVRRPELSGWGECGPVPHADMQAAAERIVEKPATAIEAILAELAPWPAIRAAAGMALLDLAGKIARAPLYQVLGGPTRNKVRAMAPLEGEGDEALKRSLEQALEAGYRALLVPLPPITARNHGQAFVLGVRRRMEQLQREAGEGADFVLDGAGRLTAGDAASVARALEPLHPMWFDEPCPVSNLSTIRKISAETVLPLGFGRFVGGAGEFQDLLREGVVDVLRPDLALHAIPAIRKTAAMAETYYTAVAPYHTGGPVATAAALHLAAGLPNFFLQQIPFPTSERARRMRAELTGESIEAPKDGFLPLPAGPGLGIEPDERAMDNYKESDA